MIAASPVDPAAFGASLAAVPSETDLSIIVVGGPGSEKALAGAVRDSLRPRVVFREDQSAAALFASVAQDFGVCAIGVILSGADPQTAADALRAIKERGGVTLVQDPNAAVFDAGPRAAIAAGLADRILGPAAIGSELAISPPDVHCPPESTGDIEAEAELQEEVDEGSRDEGFWKILAILKNRFRVDLASYKQSTVRRRIERRMSQSAQTNLTEFAEYLRSNAEATKELHDDLFIHVTQFFRDPESFEALRTVVFPALIKDRQRDDAIRIWVPGCSTGEEAYSIAIALTEFLEAERKNYRIQIFATDISEVAIEEARRATYTEQLVEGLGARRIDRFFDRTSEGYKLKKELRDLCTVSRHDLTLNPPFARLDLISCRNVLIYFGAGLQKKVVPVFHYALKTGAFLWLGRAESTGASSKLFSVVEKTHKIYAKLSAPRGYLGSRGFAHGMVLPSVPAREHKSEAPFQLIADQLLLSRYAPAGVVINENLDILQFRGRTTPFLEPASGAPTHNFFKMLHPQLLPALRSLLQTAKRQNAAVRKEAVIFEERGTRRAVNLDVTPLNPFAPERERQLLVLFEEKENFRGEHSAPHQSAEPRPASLDKSDAYVEQLQQEYDALREYQQTLVEQFEATQEELTSANEELQATNEEVQSTNEELETAKEELQAANEELTTTNDELQNRNLELIALNDRLARGEDRFRLMIEGVRDYAIYMLDPDGVVTSWNEGARRLKGYEAGEILGQNYSRFFTQEDRDVSFPLHELEHARIEGRFEGEGWRLRKNGSRFWANVVLTRINDSTGKLLGFSKVTRDLTERKISQEQLADSERRFRLMISGVRDYAIFMLDPEWRVASWNEGAKELKGYSEQEVLGRHFSIFYTADDIAGGKLEREQNAVAAMGRVEDEGWRVRKNGSRFWANVVITRIVDAEGKLLGFSKVTRDLSERKIAEEALQRANESLEKRVRDRTEELERALKTRDEFLSIASHELKTPLTGLKLQLQIARRNFTPRKGGAEGPQSTDTFDRALKQALALEQLIEDLLDISRIQTGGFELELAAVDVSAVVEDVAVRFAEQLAQTGSELKLELDRSLVASWDPRRITQVFANLLSNAIKYAPGAPITIRTRRSGARAGLIVEDAGPGISKENQPSIFDRFERAGASPNIGGLGLGLFIVRQIVEAHQGTIRVESELGQGARFVIDLPLMPDRNLKEVSKEGR